MEDKRNFILLGHAQSGKTTLSEALLYFCHATTRKGTIAEGTTISDYNFDEIERKSSVNLSLLFCDYKNIRIQIVDVPGYLDFWGEVLSGMRAVDSAIVIIDATVGVEVGTERAWQLLERLNLPCFIFINKLDKEGADLNKTLLNIRNMLSQNAYTISSLEDQKLVELIVESNDALLEKYLEGSRVAEDELKMGLRQAILKRKIFPVFSGSALNDEGVSLLLEAIREYLPSPLERPKLEVFNPENPQETKTVDFSNQDSFLGFVFKSIFDPYVGQLTLFRVFLGKLVSNTSFYNVNKKIKERIGQLYLLQGKEQRPIEEASCGDIVAVAKLKETATSDTLSSEENFSMILKPIFYPEPVFSTSIRPKSRQDEDRISGALNKLIIEDPTFKMMRDAQTKELIILGLGDLHVDVMVGRMKKRFNVEVELGVPKIPYKETITKINRAQGKYKRQTGGRGQYGDTWIEVEPLERGRGFEFVDKIFGGAIPKNFIPSVEKGVLQACQEGVLAGYPLVDIRVTLYDGSYHEVDSSDIAFQIAGSMALKKAASEAGPTLLEPIMDVEIVIPEEYLGAITGDLNSRRGRVLGIEPKGKSQIIKACVPLAEMFRYASDLRSITGGRGMYTLKFSYYEEVPSKIALNIINQYQASKKQGE